MNYKQCYKVLNSSGAIDEIINSEQKNGESLSIIKMHIIDGINYYVDFTKSTSFKRMEYWKTATENSYQRVVRKIEKALAEHELAEAKKNIECYEYLLKSIRA